jgi:hypothetical protein
MPFDNVDLEYSKSFRDEDCFAVAAKHLLAKVGQKHPEIANDLLEIIALVLEKQKTYIITAQDKWGRKKINFAEYDADFGDWQEGEAKLVAASERLYEKYKDDPAKMQTLMMIYAKCVSLLPTIKNTARENLLDIYRKERDKAVKRRFVKVDHRVPGGILNYLTPNPEPDKKPDENFVPRDFSFKTIEDFTQYVNATVIKPVITAHPNNHYQEKYLRLLLEFAAASREVAQGKDGSHDRYERALTDLIDTQMSPTTAGGLPTCFTPAEETDMEMLTLESIYHNMSGPRRIFDEALRNMVKLRKEIRHKYTAKDSWPCI